MNPDKIIRCKYLQIQDGITGVNSEVRIAICDDEIEDVKHFRRVVQHSLGRLGIAGNIDIYMHANELLGSKINYDIIFLDIEMPDKGGLQTAKELRDKTADSKVIFVTNYREYIQEAYKVQPFRYLYKTDPEKWIQEAIADALKENDSRRGIMLEGSGRFYYILLDKILYIEALGDEVLFVLEGQEQYITRVTVKSIYEILESKFVRCNRGMLVSFKHIRRVEAETVTLDNGMKIPISYRERRNVKEKYREYIRRIISW